MNTNKVIDVPVWVICELDNLGILEYLKEVKCLLYTDIEIFAVTYNKDFSDYVSVFKNNTNYNNWIVVETIKL